METLVMPRGKTVKLYHYTTPAKAKKLAVKGFTKRTGTDTKWTYFTTRKKGVAGGFGEGVVSIRLSHKAITRDRAAELGTRTKRTANAGKPVRHPRWVTQRKPETWIEYDSKNLKGVKVRDLTPKKARKQTTKLRCMIVLVVVAPRP